METRAYPPSNASVVNATKDETPAVASIRQIQLAYEELVNSLNFMRSERDYLSNAIREMEQKLADLSGMNNATTPGSIHTVGMR